MSAQVAPLFLKKARAKALPRERRNELVSLDLGRKVITTASGHTQPKGLALKRKKMQRLALTPHQLMEPHCKGPV